ncbi:hypothetical protein [Rhizobium herbae]|uniref:DUF551 domain-containing protein n=1 Tax=Rhizobium herbae TaxID=508661 RepID=A0ABS4ES52_9HYPH|nr:hypothetical protein [Rhizobium herbae]MBP1860769.1 hypothetical protein [Rhizobium herbae]
MDWYPIEALEAGKLAVLRFENEDAQRWVGYIHGDGICHWPENVSGRKPDGWQDLSALFVALPDTTKQILSAAL